MLTRQNKIGLVLAFVLGLSDIAIIAALFGGDDGGLDDQAKPPVAIVAISVAIGLATLIAVVMAWRSPTWPLMIGVIVLRALSALGDLAGLGQSTAVVIISLVLFALCALDIWLLRNWIKKPAPVG